MRWDPRHALCVVIAAGGYPGTYAKGAEIEGLEDAAAVADAVVFHAGTKPVGGKAVTNGGRVLNVTGLGADLREAQKRAYEAVDRIRFDGAFCRRDIGWRALRRG